MKIIEMKLTDLKPYEKNPRKNDNAVKYVAKSIEKFGFKVPIIIDKNNVIVCGHTRYKAAKRLKYKTVPCIIADDLTDEQIKAFRLADNRVQEMAEWDNDLLSEELGELVDWDMSDFGFNFEKEDEKKQTEEDDFDVDASIEKNGKTDIVPGDIFLLGEHRLMCGDSTKIDDVDRLMCGGKAKLALTDPPYGVKRDKGFGGAGGFDGAGKSIKRREYSDNWDEKPASQEGIDNIIKFSDNAVIFGGNYFTDKLPVGEFWLVWDKHNTMPTFGDCELAWTNIKRKSVKKYDVEWNGLIGKEKERFHPTQKPVKLMAEIIGDFSKYDDIVLDLYAGSGTTLIACEQLGRKCYAMELEPKYVAVIIDRWEQLTGRKAVKLE